MSKYIVDQTYLFVHVVSHINNEFELSNPDNILIGADSTYFRNIGKVAERKITEIKFKELTCITVTESKCSYGSDTKYTGYIFTDEEKNIFAIQYPYASYGQLSDRGDYIASRYDAEKEKSRDIEELAKEGYLDSYILFSYLLQDIDRGIRETFPTDKRTIRVDYYKDYLGQLNSLKGQQPIPDSNIDINIHEQLRSTMNYYLSNMPERWIIKIITENIKSQKDGHRYLMNNIIVEKGSILR